jgi:UDP:flavonoid glycosyltransferase YjiC (YdhE family)
MRILFVTSGSIAAAFALCPTVNAARNAGHEVIMASNDEILPAVISMGVPAVSVCSHPNTYFLYHDRSGQSLEMPTDSRQRVVFTGHYFGRMAAAWLRPLQALADDWRPDVIVGGIFAFSGALLATRLGVPYVRHAVDAFDASGIDRGAEAELAAELADTGHDRLSAPDLFIDVCPPSLLPPEPLPAKQTLRMRWIPMNGQRRLEPWMYKATRRPRVCLTVGSRVAHDVQDFRRGVYDLLRGLAAALERLHADLVVAAPDDVGREVRSEVPGTQAGWTPLDVLAPTCDVVVHHGGGATSLTALSAGVPQVMIPQGGALVENAQRLARYGAAIALERGVPVQRIISACEEILSDRSYADRARSLSQEIAALTPPPGAVDAMAAMAQGHRVPALAGRGR